MTVVLVTGPFGASERTIEIERPMSVAEIIAAHQLQFRLPTIAVMDGEPVMRGEWALRMVRPTELLTFVAVPGGGGGSGGNKQVIGLIASLALAVAAPWAGAALAGAMGFTGATLTTMGSVFSAALIAGGSVLLNALFAPPTSTASQADDVYLVNAAGNTAKPLEPLVCLYGTLRYAPPFASRPYSEFAGNDQFLYQLFFATVGKAAITKIDIGETEAWNSVDGYSSSFSDLTFEIVQPGQDVTLFPANVVTSGEVAGQVVPDPADVLGPFVVNAAGSTIDRLAVDFAFPGGLWKAADRGVDRNNIHLRAQYRAIDDDGDPIGAGTWSSIFAENVSAATRTPQRMTRSAAVPPGRYEVRFLADEAFDSDDGNSVNKCAWTGLRGYLTGFVTPPGCTLLAMKVRANEQLSQFSSSQIRITATRHLPVWDGATWSDPEATRSIAWAAADLLRNDDYSIGLTEQQYDLAALGTLDDTWAARGDTFNALFDRTWSLNDALRAVLRAGRAQPVRIGGRIGFVRLEPKAIRRATFTPRNIVRGSFQHRLVMFDEEKPDSVLGSYLDETVWQQREVLAGLATIGSDQPAKVEWFGITNHAQAWRESVTEAAVNAYQREFVSFTADFEGKLLVRGDPILVMHPFIEGVETAALSSRSGAVLTIDRDLSLSIAGSPYVILRARDGREWGPCLVSAIEGRELTLDADDLAAVGDAMGTLAAILPDDRSERAHVLICDGEMRPFNGLLASATPNGSKVDVVAAIDAPEVYLADGAEVMPSPWTPPTLPPAVPLRPSVLGLYAELRSAVAGLELDAMWLPAPGATSYVAEVSYDGEDTWTPVYSGASNRFTAGVLPQLLTLRVAAVSVVQGPWVIREFLAGELPDLRIGGPYIDVDLEAIAPGMATGLGLLSGTAPGSLDDLVARWDDQLDKIAGAITTANLTANAIRESLIAKFGATTAAIFEERQVRASATEALASQITQFAAELPNLLAGGFIRLEGVAGEDGASSTVMAKVFAQLGGTLSNAAWIVKAKVNLDLTTEAFMGVLGSLYVFATPDGEPIPVLAVDADTGEVTMSVANIGEVRSGLVRDADDTFRFDLDNMRIYRTDGNFDVDAKNLRIRIRKPA